MDEPLRALTIFAMVWLDGRGEPALNAVQETTAVTCRRDRIFRGTPTNMEFGCASYARLRRAFLKDQALSVYVF
jgi:hypothetical protein